MFINILITILGAALVLVGADKLTDGSVGLARRFQIPEMVIGLTIVAFGTSLPEFVVSLLSSINHAPGMAVGNIVGSNLFNTLMIVGVTGLICPMQIEGIDIIDLSVMTIGIALLWFFSYTKFTVERWEGALLTVIFTGYMAWLIAKVL